MAVIPQRRSVGPSTRAAYESDEIPDYPRPASEVPELPDDLTELDEIDIIDLLTQITGWHNYADTKLAQAQVQERAMEDELRAVAAEGLVHAWGGGKDDRVRIAEAERDASTEVRELRSKLLDAYAMRKRFEARVRAFERDAFAVSRELTRRTTMEAPNRRERRWGPG